MSLTPQISSMLDRVTLFKMEVTQIQSELRKLKSAAERIDKQMRKIQAKKQKRKGVEGIKVGFARPMYISYKMCLFMQIVPGSMVARTEVTRAISNYINHHVLYRIDEQTRTKRIFPDAVLLELFELTKEESVDIFLTYCKMQKYLNHHFSNKPLAKTASNK